VNIPELINQIFGSPQNAIAILVSVVSVLVAIGTVIFTLRDSQSGRKNTNTWEIYQAWNSNEIREGRSLARAVSKDPNWAAVKTLDQYYAYFTALDLTGANPNAPVSANAQTERAKDQPLHDLLSFYHQVGLLLEQDQVEKDFAMLLIGPSLDPRWSVLGAIPQFFVDAKQADDGIPYGGMFRFYDDYLKWKRSRLTGLNKQFVAAQASIMKQRGR
jgi:hypothetical protein